MKLLVSGGGTGGHIYPAIAVARRLTNEIPSAEVLFVGSSTGPEKEAASDAGLRFEGIDLKGFAGKSPVERVKALGLFARGTLRARKVVRDFEPDCVLGTGGYAAAPACVAGVVSRRPLVLLEMNVEPGIVTRMLARKADAVAVAYPATRDLIRRTRAVVTGVPVRPEIESLGDDLARERVRKEGIETFRLEEGRRTLLVFGGSQGAKAINQAVFDALPSLKDRGDLQVLHVVGRGWMDEAGLACDAVEGADLIYRPVSYVERIYKAYAVSDLALCRSGAGTIAELNAARLPSVLVPFPYATGGHQDSNAEQACEAGAAVIARQVGDSAAAALEVALTTLEDEESLARMAEVAGKHAGSGSKGVMALIEEVMGVAHGSTENGRHEH